MTGSSFFSFRSAIMKYIVTVQVFNRFGEIETEQSFRSNASNAAIAKAYRWCRQGWGVDWRKLFTITKRVSTASEFVTVLELR
jgi:predicted 3-demethylubiquinone-9 3-methyltransferase (glyoxalase superfamily)